MAEIVLITGCGTGIGRALAENLAERLLPSGKRAYKVWATDYRLDAVKDLEEAGLSVAQLDVTSVESINAAVELVLTTDGRIDLLVCNAGLTAPGWLTEMAYVDIERIFNVNVHGVFRTVQPVAKSMMARRSGRIAVLASVNSYFIQPYNGPYSGTKSAVAIMAESLRLELAPFNIEVISVCPAWVKSDIINNAPPPYERYERPESFYSITIDPIRRARLHGVSGGCSTQVAANDIAEGITRPRPPRYVYTGTTLFYSLFWGCAQQWLHLWKLRKDIMDRFLLTQAGQQAPTEWKGQYVKPPPPPPEEEQPTEATNGPTGEQPAEATNGPMAEHTVPPQNGKAGEPEAMTAAVLPAVLQKEE